LLSLLLCTAADPTMPIVKFIKEKKEIEVPEGANLRSEAIKAGINLYHGMNGWGTTLNKYVNCYGFGMCGSCRVLIKKGMENTNKMGLVEKAKFKGLPVPDPACLAYIGHEDEMRLACCTEIRGDLEVETGPEFNLFGENFFS
jgi:ferredoxin